MKLETYWLDEILTGERKKKWKTSRKKESKEEVKKDRKEKEETESGGKNHEIISRIKKNFPTKNLTSERNNIWGKKETVKNKKKWHEIFLSKGSHEIFLRREKTTLWRKKEK